MPFLRYRAVVITNLVPSESSIENLALNERHHYSKKVITSNDILVLLQ